MTPQEFDAASEDVCTTGDLPVTKRERDQNAQRRRRMKELRRQYRNTYAELQEARRALREDKRDALLRRAVAAEQQVERLREQVAALIRQRDRLENDVITLKGLTASEAKAQRSRVYEFAEAFSLTRGEAQVLAAFLPSMRVSKSGLWARVYGHMTDPPLSKTLDVHIYRLRSKLGVYGASIPYDRATNTYKLLNLNAALARSQEIAAPPVDFSCRQLIVKTLRRWGDRTTVQRIANSVRRPEMWVVRILRTLDAQGVVRRIDDQTWEIVDEPAPNMANQSGAKDAA